MANTAARRGLVNPRLVTGGTPHTETRAVSSAYTTVFYPGQLVDAASNGFAVHSSAAGYSCLGVCMSYLASPNSAPSTQVDEIQVVTDMKNTLWELQLSAATAGQTIVGNNTSLKNITSVNATAKQSRMNGGTPVTAAAEFNIVGFATDPKNEPASANPRVIVKMTDNVAYHLYMTNAGI